jgi:acetylornithine deacetylase
MTQPHWREGGAVNAISKAMKIVQGMEELAEEWRMRPDKQHRFLDPDTIVPTIIRGGEWEVTVPEKVEISFDCVMLPESKKTQQEIRDKIHSIAAADPWMKEHPPRIQFAESCYGAEVSEDEPIVQTGLEVLKDLGREPGLAGFGSLTDAIHLINYSKIPTISIGPGLKTAHMADEFVSLDELIDTTKALALSIMRWCS